jgi:hypothetical protein
MDPHSAMIHRLEVLPAFGEISADIITMPY